MRSVGVEPTFHPSEGCVLSVIRRARSYLILLKDQVKSKNSFRSFLCAPGKNRTYDLLDRNQTLYPLSYGRIYNLSKINHFTLFLLRDRNQMLPAYRQAGIH